MPNNFDSLIDLLRIASLRDISKNLKISTYEKNGQVGEKDYYKANIKKWYQSTSKFYNHVLFRLSIPLIVGTIFFFIGAYSDISNNRLKEEILGAGIPEVIFFMGMPIDSVRADYYRKFPKLPPPPALFSNRHGSLIIHSFNEKYPIFDAKVTLSRSHDDTGMVLAEKVFGTIAEGEDWYINSPLYQEYMTSKSIKASSKYKQSHPNLAADEILQYNISTRGGVYEQTDCFKIDPGKNTYNVASRTFLKEIQNGSYHYILVREVIDPQYPRTRSGEVLDFSWDDKLMKLSDQYEIYYDSILNIKRVIN